MMNRPVKNISVTQLEIDDVVDHRFVVRERADTTGGTAVVYRVYDRILQADFAAKFVRPELSGNVDVSDEFNGFEPYRTILQSCRRPFRHLHHTHPRPAGAPVRVRLPADRLVQGVSLAELLTHALPLVRVLQIGAVIADALSTVEASGVVHRDVKPENVILRDQGSPVLIDFNISASSRDTLDVAGRDASILPPEIVDGDGIWTPAADVYSLAVCLVELIAGRRLGRAAVHTWVDQWSGGDELADAKSTLQGMLQKIRPLDPTGLRRPTSCSVPWSTSGPPARCL